MKILAICGSPRKGNSYAALKSIQEKFPEIDFKILMLNEMNLEKCRGCYVCFLKGEQYCPLKDDRDMIIKEMFDADGVIWASPVYTNHITSLMKNYIDRLGFIAHRPCFFGKYAMVMANCAGFGADKANDYMKGILSVYGFGVVSDLELYIATKSELENRTNHEKTLKAFDTFFAEINKRKGALPEPTLTQLIYFNIFKAISEWNKDEGKADYEFYKDKNDYLYDTKISFFKKFLANRISGKEIKKMMKDR